MQRSQVPAKFNIPFATSAGAGFIRPIPQASQIGITDGAASLTTGFPPDCFSPVGAGGVPPFGQDFNGLLFQSTAWDRWLSAGAPIVFDPTFSTAIGGYPKGAQVESATTDGVFWLSTADNNTTDPDAAGAGWVQVTPLNYYAGTDTGAANAYVVALSPALASYPVGLPIRFKPANSNTGASTLNAGTPGAKAIARRDGSPLIGGELVAGKIATVIYNGSGFEWQGVGPAPPAALLALTDTQSFVTPANLDPGKVLANPGYSKFPNGLILQWGTTGSITSGTVVSLPITFPTGALLPIATINGTPGQGVGCTLTASAITLYCTGGTASFHWWALGH